MRRYTMAAAVLGCLCLPAAVQAQDFRQLGQSLQDQLFNGGRNSAAAAEEQRRQAYEQGRVDAERERARREEWRRHEEDRRLAREARRERQDRRDWERRQEEIAREQSQPFSLPWGR